MLVGYSSSSEDEGEADQNTSRSRKCQEEDDDGDDGCPASKKPKIEEQVPKTRCVVVFCRRA